MSDQPNDPNEAAKAGYHTSDHLQRTATHSPIEGGFRFKRSDGLQFDFIQTGLSQGVLYDPEGNAIVDSQATDQVAACERYVLIWPQKPHDA